MPFIPHTEDDVSAMLSAIGVDSIEDLFDEIKQKVLEVKGVVAVAREEEVAAEVEGGDADE